MNPHSLLQQIAQIQHMERGKLSVIRQGPQGPYYKHQAWEKGKNITHYVVQDQLPALKQALAGYEQFKNLVEQYAQMIIDQTRTELASRSKKKPQPRNSSWPKSRKSSY